MSTHGCTSCPICGRCTICGGCADDGAPRTFADLTARVVGGPIELPDYNHLRLAVEHDVVLPDGSELILPAGSILIMKIVGEGLHQDGGVAARNDRVGAEVKA